MKKHLYSAFVGLCALLFTLNVSLAASGDQQPVDLLQNISNQAIEKLKANQGEIQTNTNAVYSIIETILMPHVDLEGMSRSVVGRTYWQGASNAQQTEFEKEFSNLIAGTYVSALQAYTDQTIKFYPIRGGVQPDQKRVEVNSEILQKNGPAIPVNYRLAYKNNQWLVYDLIVDGVSLLKNYRAQFAAPLKQGGMTALIDDLKSHNKK